MGKMILVIDDPKYCCNCPLAKSRRHNITKEEIWLCGIGFQDKYDYYWNPVDMDSDTKPDWCPLIPAPNPDSINLVKEVENGLQSVSVVEEKETGVKWWVHKPIPPSVCDGFIV